MKTRKIKTLWKMGLFFSFLFMPVFLFSLPKGKSARGGSVRFSKPEKKTLLIEASDRSIICYKDFSIQKGETVQFKQPSRSATVLNRVEGGKASTIHGQIKANGKVFLINSQGVVFSPSACVKTGSLVVSTLNVSDRDFAARNYRFFLSPQDKKSQIINKGRLCSVEGELALIAPEINQEGKLLANKGSILLGSGEKLHLTNGKESRLIVERGLPEGKIENRGEICASRGFIGVHTEDAQEAARHVIHLEEAVGDRLVKQGGRIYLKNKSRLEGKNVALSASAIEASGELISQEDIRLTGREKVQIRDSAETPLRALAHRDLFIRGQSVDILALNHVKTCLASGGDLTIVSEKPISADSRFSCGGAFVFARPDGEAGDFNSRYDPVISSAGPIRFGAYTGASLKAESLAGITISGDIHITAPDLAPPQGDPDASLLSSTPCLILRSDLPVLSAKGASIPPSPLVINGTTFASGRNLSGILFGGNSITTNGGPVVIEGNFRFLKPTSIATSGGNTYFYGKIDGSESLKINAGEGSVFFFKEIGSLSSPAQLQAFGSLIEQQAPIYVEGPLLFSGKWNAGGDVTTNNSDFIVKGSACALPDAFVQVSTGAGNRGNLRIEGDLEGPGSFFLNAGEGNLFIDGKAGGADKPLAILSVSGKDVYLNGIGDSSPGTMWQTLIHASHDAHLKGDVYHGAAQLYFAGNKIQLEGGGNMTLHSADEINLITPLALNGRRLMLKSGEGNISFASLSASQGENISILSEKGNVFVGDIGRFAGDVRIKGADIFLAGEVFVNDFSCLATEDIFPLSGKEAIHARGSVVLQSLGGESPLPPPVVGNAGNALEGNAASLRRKRDLFAKAPRYAAQNAIFTGLYPPKYLADPRYFRLDFIPFCLKKELK